MCCTKAKFVVGGRAPFRRRRRVRQQTDEGACTAPITSISRTRLVSCRRRVGRHVPCGTEAPRHPL